MTSTARKTTHTPVGVSRSEWLPVVSRYRNPDSWRSAWQLANTLIPYLALMALMVWSLNVSYFLTLLLAVPAAAWSVRLFILSHDCGHGSFFRSKRWNDFWGEVTALLVWTPYVYWRNEHARHHSSSGDLDRRGIGDIWTLTVREYAAKSRFTRFVYRLYRHPLILFGIGPLFLFAVGYRFWSGWARRPERLSVLRTNLFLVAIIAMFHVTIGVKAFVMVQLPVMALAASAGVWLFYVQHQFEDVYWETSENWDYFRQAIEGSSCYRLPRVLQWFTANIGYHHIHHLSPRIPNYRLERCHRDNAILQAPSEITLRTSLRSLKFRLWDERTGKMVGFHAPVQGASAAHATAAAWPRRA